MIFFKGSCGRVLDWAYLTGVETTPGLVPRVLSLVPGIKLGSDTQHKASTLTPVLSPAPVKRILPNMKGRLLK